MKKRITAIEPAIEPISQKRIFLDGGFFAAVDAKVVSNFGLRVGLEIEANVLEKILQADEFVRARDHALTQLKENTYTKSQMQEFLSAAGYATEAVEAALAYLEEHGHIRDAKFAASWMKRRQRSNPKGRQLLKQELVDKGVDESAAVRVVNQMSDADEADVALQLAEKQAKRYRSLPNTTARRRLYAFLQRRGFDHVVIQRTVEQVLGECGNAE